MSDNAHLAAILASGMLAPLPPPGRNADGSLPRDEQDRLVLAISHAVSLYSSVLEALSMRAEARQGEQIATIPSSEQPRKSSVSFVRDGFIKCVAAFLATAFLTIATAGAADCVNADPGGELGSVHGDFEIQADPHDPDANLILISNTDDGAASIVAARFDGVTGQLMPGSLTTIANNFYGYSLFNGPEFVQTPTGELGVVYAGLGGVHAVFRPAGNTEWNNFSFSVAGKRTYGSPPLLPSTADGTYPAAPIPLGQRTYGEYKGTCLGICFGALDGGVTTDIKAVLNGMGLAAYSGVQAPTDGYFYAGACNGWGYCGIYEAQIDGVGGLVPNSLQKVADTGRASPMSLVAAQHPVTGSTVVFSNEGTALVEVWQQSEPGAKLSLVNRVQVATGETHFRAEADPEQLVLHYLVRTGADAGSYTVPVAAPGNVLSVGSNKKISNHGSGAELAWLPAVGKWALFYRSDQHLLRRCWITP